MALAGDHVQVLISGYELTGDSNRIVINDKRDMHDMTAFGDAVHKFLLGQRISGIEHIGYLNSQAARSHPVLKANSFEGVVSILLGQNAAPAVGDPTYSLEVLQGHYATMPETGKYVPFTARFATKNQGGWGVALATSASFNGNSTGTSVNNGGPTINGGAAFLHVLQAAPSDVYTLIVEGANDAGFTSGVTTLATFTLNGSQLGSERQEITGVIPQYTRWKATRTSGSSGVNVKIAANLVRYINSAYEQYINSLLPRLWLRLREGSGTTAVNAGTGGGALNGTVAGTPTLGQPGYLGADEAFDFNGTTSKINVPNDTVMANATEWTFAALVKPDSLGETNIGTIFAWGNLTADYTLRFTGANSLTLRVDYDGTNGITGTNEQLPLGLWSLVFGTYSQSGDRKGRLYRGAGGTLTEYTYSQQTASVGALVVPAVPFVIGGLDNQTASWDGLIDEVLWFDRVLTVDQMTQIVKLAGV